MRETRAQSRMCTRANHGRGAAATVCAGWECWRWYGGGTVGALAAWSLCSLSLFPRRSYSISLPLSIPLSLFSPSLVPVPPNSPPFLLPPSNSPHLCLLPLPWLLYSPLVLPSKPPLGLSFSSRGDPNSVCVAVTPENQALVLSLPLCPLLPHPPPPPPPPPSLLLLETPRLYF